MSQPILNTLCIGRLLIDLPENTQVSADTSFQRIESKEPGMVRDFSYLEQQLTQRANGYKVVRMVRTPDDDESWKESGYDPDKLYAKTQLVGFDTDSILQQAVIGYHPDPKSSKLGAELHRVIGHREYVFIYNGKGISAGDYQRIRQALWQAGTTFHPLTPDTQPTGPGFCVEGGMFADAGKPPVRESFTLVVTFTDHPDVRFVIDANAIDQVNKNEPSLKHRVDSELEILRASVKHVSVLERGALKAAGQEGYQIAVSAPYDLLPNTRLRKFFWSADGVPNDVTRPFMEIDMTIQPTSDGQTTIQDDDKAKELWQQLMQGVRIRPGAA